jgi:hypothetical protein
VKWRWRGAPAPGLRRPLSARPPRPLHLIPPRSLLPFPPPPTPPPTPHPPPHPPTRSTTSCRLGKAPRAPRSLRGRRARPPCVRRPARSGAAHPLPPSRVGAKRPSFCNDPPFALSSRGPCIEDSVQGCSNGAVQGRGGAGAGRVAQRAAPRCRPRRAVGAAARGAAPGAPRAAYAPHCSALPAARGPGAPRERWDPRDSRGRAHNSPLSSPPRPARPCAHRGRVPRPQRNPPDHPIPPLLAAATRAWP